ncbi:hypothetical protein G7046_g4136 [Stylonectria norvegica]|nr:hypothetical protein G7046_g4136 [Stylonectria norvegica]
MEDARFANPTSPPVQHQLSRCPTIGNPLVVARKLPGPACLEGPRAPSPGTGPRNGPKGPIRHHKWRDMAGAEIPSFAADQRQAAWRSVASAGRRLLSSLLELSIPTNNSTSTSPGGRIDPSGQPPVLGFQLLSLSFLFYCNSKHQLPSGPGGTSSVSDPHVIHSVKSIKDEAVLKAEVATI